ncbi:hypothetical protein AVEN_47541-1 [Araneus ventricosus]|uniref:Uncharacterized protein n=1 Tax=Araneus ventricosus TaxID=182803 RepID=A0A4Y2S299_ARAVE|nr:hypothetical protein AVEN_47541-1 [Araneus ventricosus]
MLVRKGEKKVPVRLKGKEGVPKWEGENKRRYLGAINLRGVWCLKGRKGKKENSRRGRNGKRRHFVRSNGNLKGKERGKKAPKSSWWKEGTCMGKEEKKRAPKRLKG